MKDQNDVNENDHLDGVLKQYVAGYRNPDASAMSALRNEMWDAIQTQRAGESTARRTSGVRLRIYPWAAYALAACLLLTVGIGIGKHIGRKNSFMPTISNMLADAEEGHGQVSNPLARATSDHFFEAALLLVSFNNSSFERKLDDDVMVSAQDLLSKTRLLLDSRALVDPQRRKLLMDLEMILVQIVQLSGKSASAERKIITDAITTEQVIPKLRLAAPQNI